LARKRRRGRRERVGPAVAKRRLPVRPGSAAVALLAGTEERVVAEPRRLLLAEAAEGGPPCRVRLPLGRGEAGEGSLEGAALRAADAVVVDLWIGPRRADRVPHVVPAARRDDLLDRVE